MSANLNLLPNLRPTSTPRGRLILVFDDGDTLVSRTLLKRKSLPDSTKPNSVTSLYFQFHLTASVFITLLSRTVVLFSTLTLTQPQCYFIVSALLSNFHFPPLISNIQPSTPHSRSTSLRGLVGTKACRLIDLLQHGTRTSHQEAQVIERQVETTLYTPETQTNVATASTTIQCSPTSPCRSMGDRQSTDTKSPSVASLGSSATRSLAASR